MSAYSPIQRPLWLKLLAQFLAAVTVALGIEAGWGNKTALGTETLSAETVIAPRPAVLAVAHFPVLVTAGLLILGLLIVIRLLLKQRSRQRIALQQQTLATQKAQLFADIASAPVLALSEAAPVLQRALTEARQLLRADRVMFYRLRTDGVTLDNYDWPSDWQHYLSLDGWVSEEAVSYDQKAADTYEADASWIPQSALSQKQPSTQAFDQVTQAETDSAYIGFLSQLDIQSSLNVPVFVETSADSAGGSQMVLWGYVLVHHCQQPHIWQIDEIEFVQQLSAQIKQLLYRVAADVNIRQARLKTKQSQQESEQSRQEVERSRQALNSSLRAQQQQTEQQRQQNNRIQQQTQILSSEISGLLRGDLTVRASVNQGELKTISQAFNLAVEKLESLVTQIKESTQQVEHFFHANETTALQLSRINQQQTQEAERTSNAVQKVCDALGNVATLSDQAATDAQQVTYTVRTGESSVAEASHQVAALNSLCNATLAQVNQLSRSTHNVSYMTSMVSDIATEMQQLSGQIAQQVQTVGESESGIAVQPLRSSTQDLTKLSQKAIAEARLIDTFLTSVGQTSEQLVLALTNINEQVNDSYQTMQTCQQDLGEVRAIAAQFEQLTQSVTAATHEQAQISQTAAELVKAVVTLSARSATFSQQMTDSLQANMDTAQALKASVSGFRVTSR